ncbi:MAG: dihydropteroate synthase [Haloferacaceae archaeon]
MDYQEAAEFLLDLRRFGVSPGTDSIRELLADLDDPHEGLTFVQVAGSNGKGSTARMVESCLREAGYRVGLYTSPHLEDLRERVRVDGRKVPRAAVASFVERARPLLVERAAAGDPVTFFEAMTALALWRFDRGDCDVAVLEVGLGGRYDATSVVDPAAAAVTNVSLEHTQVLGDTVEAIAAEMAAVEPADGPLVTAATGGALDALRDETGDLITVGEGQAADVRVAYRGRTDTDESAVEVDAGEWRVEARVPVLGACQARNAGVAAVLVCRAASVLDGPAVDADVLERGLRGAHWPGRFEVMERAPLTVLDGAHNPEACVVTTATLAEFDYDDLHVVFAAMHEKDHAGMVEALPAPASVHTCAPTIDRAEDPAVLAAVWERESDVGSGVVKAGDAVGDALRAARDRAGDDDCVLVVGSLFAVAEARERWIRAVRPLTAADGDAAATGARDAGAPTVEVERVRERGAGRTVALRLDRRRAERLRALASDAGVAPAVRAGRADGELVEVVLAGPRDRFRALVDALSEAGDALPGVGDDLRRTLGLDDGRPRHGYPWEEGTAVMGVLNVTPDSFHDGGEYRDPAAAVERAERMAAAGADVIDVGGESTRPGANPVSVEAELDRVLPVIEAVAGTDALVSIDTRKAAVGRAALDAGADVLNDVTGLEDPEMRFLAAERGVPIVVMHSIDAPVVPGKEVAYDDVVADVTDELRERVLLATKAGVPREKVIVDPGLGFGKSAAENFALLGRLDELRALGCPVLIGHSHKSMFDLVDRGAGERLPATVAATALAADRGADLVRVHDVPENVAAVRTALAARDPTRFAGRDEGE